VCAIIHLKRTVNRLKGISPCRCDDIPLLRKGAKDGTRKTMERRTKGREMSRPIPCLLSQKEVAPQSRWIFLKIFNLLTDLKRTKKYLKGFVVYVS